MASNGSSLVGAAGQVNDIPLNIGIQGNFANIKAFLTGIESMPRSVLVTGLTITRNNAGSAAKGDELVGSIAGHVFSQNPDPGSQASSGAAAAGTVAAPGNAAGTTTGTES